MKARQILRTATAADHDRVDGLFSQLDLSKMEDYRLFLTAQAAAHLPVEAAIDAAAAENVVPDWPERRRAGLLRADLDDLGIGTLEPVPSPTFTSGAAVLGAVYVLEGSRLGGALLKRSLPDIAPKRFIGAAQPSGHWRKLLELLDDSLYEMSALESATRAAQQVFQCFEAGGLRVLETEVK